MPSPEAALPFDAPAANSEDDDERKGRDWNKNNEEDDKDKNNKHRAGRGKEGFLWDKSKGID